MLQIAVADLVVQQDLEPQLSGEGGREELLRGAVPGAADEGEVDGNGEVGVLSWAVTGFECAGKDVAEEVRREGVERVLDIVVSAVCSCNRLSWIPCELGLIPGAG